MTRSISSGALIALDSWAGSGMIQRNWESPVNSSMSERASGWRRSDLEKKMISATAELARLIPEIVGQVFTHVSGTAGSSGAGECGTSWQVSSYRRSACWSLGVAD